MTEGSGRRSWAIPGGRVPLRSTGDEPENTSRDELCILNTGAETAHVAVRVYFEDQEPAGPFRLEVGARRVCHVRVNDLIDPQAVPLDTPYAAVVESDVPVVVMFLRKDTSQEANAVAASMAFPLD